MVSTDLQWGSGFQLGFNPNDPDGKLCPVHMASVITRYRQIAFRSRNSDTQRSEIPEAITLLHTRLSNCIPDAGAMPADRLCTLVYCRPRPTVQYTLSVAQTWRRQLRGIQGIVCSDRAPSVGLLGVKSYSVLAAGRVSQRPDNTSSFPALRCVVISTTAFAGICRNRRAANGIVSELLHLQGVEMR